MLRAFDPDFIHGLGEMSLGWVPKECQRQYPRHYTTLYATYAPTPAGGSVHDFHYQDVLPLYGLMSREVTRIGAKNPFIMPIVGGSTYHLLYKTIYGAFPTDFHVPFEQIFREYLSPYHLPLTDTEPLRTLDPWNDLSPLRLTAQMLYPYSGGPTHPIRIVFAGDPFDIASLIDFWNLRATGNAVLFVPLSQFKAYGRNVQEFYKSPQPVRDWSHLLLVFARSNTDDTRLTLTEWFTSLFPNMTQAASVASMSADYWRNLPYRIPRFSYTDESDTLAPIAEGKFQYQTTFPQWLRPQERTLEGQWLYVEPSFQGLYGENYLTDFPNDPGIEANLGQWCGVGQNGRITEDGLSLLRGTARSQMQVQLPRGEEALEAVFGARQMTVKLSEPGHVAKQIIAQLGSVTKWPIFKVRAVRETLDLLNDGKGHPLQEIMKIIGTTLSAGPKDLYVEPEKPIGCYKASELLGLMHRMGMVQQGWNLQCNKCSMYEWYPVSDLGSDFICRWCFTKQPTPQLVCNSFVRYEYRGNGLYLAHGKQKGSIPVILSLWRLLKEADPLMRGVYSTSIEVRACDKQQTLVGELDFCLLMPHAGFRGYKLVLGEARGQKDYTEEDCATIRQVAQQFGGEFVKEHLWLCFSTLKERFSQQEKCFYGA